MPHDKAQQLVRDSRERESWGKEEVRKLLEEQVGRRVSDKSVRNLLGEFHYESQYSTDHAMYKLPIPACFQRMESLASLQDSTEVLQGRGALLTL